MLVGITPAYAGNTLSLISNQRSIQDHPRIRGEHSCYFICTILGSGSPPHTRGTLGPYKRQKRIYRITPAYAGNTRFLQFAKYGKQDHPRIRGEHSVMRKSPVPNSGSPPHTRGTPYLTIFSPPVQRITPAYAGNTLFEFPFFGSEGDHPRIRGEHQKSPYMRRLFLGSPPHTRGTLASDSVSYSFSRITPAYAGNTPMAAPTPFKIPDHPRIRGEHLRAGEYGSHTRGTPFVAVLCVFRLRITPAYAGNTPIS